MKYIQYVCIPFAYQLKSYSMEIVLSWGCCSSLPSIANWNETGSPKSLALRLVFMLEFQRYIAVDHEILHLSATCYFFICFLLTDW